MSILYSKVSLGPLALQNRLVMCPLTRSRAINNVPNDLMAEYYAQRASVGLIITEGTSPSPDGIGYPRIPGVYSQEQVRGWRRVVDAVHAEGAKVFLQLMHCGRIADSDEAGHAFQYEAGHRFRSEAGRNSDLKPATLRSLPRIETIMFRPDGLVKRGFGWRWSKRA